MEQGLRLRDGADFQRVRNAGPGFGGSFLRLRVAPGRKAHNRYGLVAGRHIGGAVKRNRVKRLLREALRCLHPELLPGHDVVVEARPQLPGQSLASVCQALRQQMRRAGLLAGEAASG